MAKEERNGHLTSRAFGGVQITHNNSRSEITITREFQALLNYLLLQHYRIYSREILAGMFCKEKNQEKECKCLNIALWKWKLKKALEAETRENPSYGASTHYSIIILPIS
jgi:DNA-binding SARP family transcriptional activator